MPETPLSPDLASPDPAARRASRARDLSAGLAAVILTCLIALFAASDRLPTRIVPRAEAHEQARPGYVGSAQCGECHAAAYAAWRGSDHARAMLEATAANVLGDFSAASVTDRDRSAAFRRDGERFIVRTDGPDGRTADFTVSETFGVDPLQQYLVRFPDGRRQALPWAWDSRPSEQGGQRWYHLMPAETLRAGDPLHWTGRDQTWNFMCASCHSTGLVRGYEAATDRYDTTWTEISVGCESCHGRGAAHVAWARAGAQPSVPDHALEVALRDASGGAWQFAADDPRGIARWEGPPRQATATQMDVCATCHARARPIVADAAPGARFLDTHAPALLARDLYHADGQIRGEVFEWGSFAQSRMQRAGVVCADCHEPHGGRLRAEGNAVCAQCHLPARFDTADHHRHAPGTAAAQCASCHMPAVTYMGVDRRRDHGFRVPRPDVSAAIGTPNACTSCHTGQTASWAASRITSWFGPSRRDNPHFALAIDAGRRGLPGADLLLAAVVTDRTQAGIVRATALSLMPGPPTRAAAQAIVGAIGDADPLLRAAAVRALNAVPPPNRGPAIALLDDTTRLVRIEAARTLAPVPAARLPAPARAAFDRAWTELLASERVAAERPEAHVNLAGLFTARGDLAAAESSYRDALTRDASFLPALVNMADFENRRGRTEQAEVLLMRAIAAHPASAEAHHALGLTRVRRGRAQEALGSLAEAARLRPDEPRYAYVYAVGLNDLGNQAAAATALRASLTRHPDHRDSLMALATIERGRANLSAAEQLAARAAALDPQDRAAATLLEQIRTLRQRLPGSR